MKTQSYCSKRTCGKAVDGDIKHCPDCKSRMVSTKSIRQTGCLMAIVGGLISTPMGVVLVKFLPVALDPEAAVAAGRFDGPAELVPWGTGLLLLAFGFGLSSLSYGLFRMVTGRRNAVLKALFLLLSVAFLLQFFYLGSLLPDTKVN